MEKFDPDQVRLSFAMLALIKSDFYEAMIKCRSCPIVRSAGLRMKARAIVGHDRVLMGLRA